MRIFRILLLGIIGLAVGLALSYFPGYYEAWHELPSPPLRLSGFLSIVDETVVARATDGSLWRCASSSDECWLAGTVPDIMGYPATQVIEPCDFSSFEFSFFAQPPKHISACIQGLTQYPEAQGRNTYVLDTAGKVWEWVFIGNPDARVQLAPLFCAVFGIMVGIVALMMSRLRGRTEA